MYPSIRDLVELPMTEEVEQLSDVTTRNPGSRHDDEDGS